MRRRLALPFALAAGLAIGFVDSRPSWDDTGVTAGLLLVAGGVAAALAPRRALLVVLGVGLPTPLLELHDRAAFAALVFAAAGAAVGALAARAPQEHVHGD